MITIDRVDHIGIRVADVDRATAFYDYSGSKPCVRQKTTTLS